MYPRRSWKFFQSIITLNTTRFVTIYGFVQSNIQHVSPAFGGFAARPTGALLRLPLDPAGGLPPPDPLFFVLP